MAPFSLLLLDAEAARLAAPLSEAVEGLRVTPSTSLVAARAHLVGTTFDAVLAAADLPDGSALSLLEGPLALPPTLVRTKSAARAKEAETAGAHLGFVGGADDRILAAVIAWTFGLRPPGAPTEAPHAAAAESSPEASGGAPGTAAVLAPIRDEMSRIAHDLNNPLAVIAGNAQLARELIAVAPDDEMVATSITDIGTAAAELVALVDEVTALRRRIDAAIDD